MNHARIMALTIAASLDHEDADELLADAEEILEWLTNGGSVDGPLEVRFAPDDGSQSQLQ